MKPRILDLFCGAGGAGMGYHLAGFEVIGVDNKPQKNYPFEFHQADALEFVAARGHNFDAIHASPPCQGYSVTRFVTNKKDWPLLIPKVRDLLTQINKPFVIENVPGSPLFNAITLCGTMFGLNIIRHRLFEVHPTIWFNQYSCCHYKKVVPGGRAPKENEFHSVVGHHSGVKLARQAMGIEWMTQLELSQAIPPAYTEYIGRHLINILTGRQDPVISSAITFSRPEF